MRESQINFLQLQMWKGRLSSTCLPRLSHSEDPLKFLLAHATHFPCLSSLSLVIPPTSANSECVVNSVGNAVTPTHCSLKPGKVHTLIKINKLCDLVLFKFFLYRYMPSCTHFSFSICSIGFKYCISVDSCRHV